MALYQQIKDRIRTQIASGTWRPGRRIPSENALVDSFGVSRMTVNRAIRELTGEGLLVRQAGVGTFVAEASLTQPAMPISDVAEEIRQLGAEHACQVLCNRSQAVSAEIAPAMGIRSGNRVHHLLALHHASGQPFMLEERWINPEVLPEFAELDFTQTTATHVLLQKVPLQRVEQTFSAKHLSATTRQLVALDETPCLVISRRTFCDEHRIATFAHLYYLQPQYAYGPASHMLPAPSR